MLEIKNLSIKFDQKTILDNTSFKASNNQMIVISGRSGIGKSTFLNTFLFKYNCNYLYHQLDLMSLNQEEQNSFIYEKLAFIHQIPLFLEGMTIEDHIDLLKKLGHQRNKELEQRLQIDKLINKYPKNLSGGEKTRIATYLALIQNKEILILDEPTASLDKDNANIMIEVLKKYAHQGNIVIIASHDKKIINQADVIYKIKDHQLVSNTDISDNLKIKWNPRIKKQTKNINIATTHKLFQACMLVLVSLSMLFAVFSGHIYNGYSNDYKESIDQVTSRELIVYKEKYENDYYTYDGLDFPFSKKEVSKLKQLKNVEDISWHYDNSLNFVGGFEKFINCDKNKINHLSLSLNDNYICQNKEVYYNLHSYNEKHNYDDLMLFTTNQKGLILSDDLYKELIGSNNIKESDYKNLSLLFYLAIPLYDASNIAEHGTNIEGKFVDANAVNCVFLPVTLPIAGVLGDGKNMYNIGADVTDYNSLFIPNDILQKYINEYRAKQSRILFWTVQNQQDILYYDKLPNNIPQESVAQTVTQVPWQPNCYIVTVDRVENVNEVKDEIVKLGFGVEGQFVNSDDFSILSKENETILISFLVVIFIILYSFYTYLKYLVIKDEETSRLYFRNLGFNTQEINKIFYKKYFKNACELAFVTACMLRISIEIFAKMQIIPLIFLPQPIHYIFIIVLSFIIELIIPLILNKIVSK